MEKKARLGPKSVLALLCGINLLVYCDRGVISSNGVLGSTAHDVQAAHGIQGDFGLSAAELGLLPSAFMVGLLVTSPVFAQASKHYGGFRLITVGLGLWIVSTALAGLSRGYWSLLIARMVVGVGEASFVALAAPFIDDAAPKDSKGSWLALFYLCVPSGYAMGYIFGGLLALPLGWRGPLLVEAALMVPLLGVCLLLPAGKPAAIELPSAGEASTAVRGALAELGQDMLELCRHPIYLIGSVGCTFHTAVLGLYGFFGAKSGAEVFRLPGPEVDSIFGAVTVLTGVGGTLAGGMMLDRLGSTVPNALAVCAICCGVACLFIFIAFAFAASLPVFLGPFALGELALFAVMAPSNAILLWSVPHMLRPLAMSSQVVLVHLAGDVPVVPLLGWLQDHVQNWRVTMSVGTSLLLLAGATFGLGIRFSKGQPDYRLLATPGTSSMDEEHTPVLSGQRSA